MSLKKLTMLSVVILAFLFLTTGLVFSQMTEREKPSKSGLGLSPEHKEKVKSIAFEGRKEEIRLHSDLEIANLELRELLHQEKLDKAKINRKLDEIGALRTKLEKAKVDQLMAFRDVLTKEQIQSFRERRLHRAFDRKVIRKRIKLNEGRSQRFQRQGMGMGPLSEEAAPSPLTQEEEMELSIAPEEPPVDPEQALMEEELAPLFDEVEPAPPMEEFQPLPDEAPLPEELH
ncbi:MAG: periplasmic heavy metal sensor [candidate division Zixibacteria bacterium]|nr:periplasmic heavy metal sensor [candidate division Zixibacteria bacterium]